MQYYSDHMRNRVRNHQSKVSQYVDCKNFLYAWLGRRHLPQPVYDTKQATCPPNPISFECSAVVTGYKFIGHGIGKAKKQAQTNAALNFLDHLVKADKIDKKDIPQNIIYQILECKNDDHENTANSEAQSSQSFQEKQSTPRIKTEPNTSKSTPANSQSSSASIVSTSSTVKSNSKPKLNFYDDTVYDNDNDPVIDTNAINSPKYVYAPRIDTSHEYNGPYDLNVYRVRDTLVKSLGGGFYPRFSRANKNKYDQYFYLMEKLKYKLGIKRLVTTRFEQRLWQEIKEETFDVSQRIHKNYIFVNSRIEDYKY